VPNVDSKEQGGETIGLRVLQEGNFIKHEKISQTREEILPFSEKGRLLTGPAQLQGAMQTLVPEDEGNSASEERGECPADLPRSAGGGRQTTKKIDARGAQEGSVGRIGKTTTRITKEQPRFAMCRGRQRMSYGT